MALESREQLEQIQQMLSGLRNFTDTTYSSRVEMERLRDAEMKTRFGFNNFTASTKLGADAVAKLASAATNYAGALYQGQRGFAAMNDSLDSVSSAAKLAGGALMLLGGPIGMVVGALSMLTGYAIDAAKEIGAVSDAQYEAYKTLSEFGVAASDGMTGLQKVFTVMGSAPKQYEKNIEVLRELSSDLSLFGGTVYRGRERFVSVIAALRDFREPMMRMGMDVEQANRAIGSYIKIQNRYGFLTGMSIQQIAGAAKAYVMEQEALTKLTGLTRKEQEALLEQQRNRERYAGLQMELKAKGETKLANTYDSIYIALSKFGPETAQGFIDAVSDPYGFTESSVKFMRLTGGASAEILDKLRKGEIDGAEAIGQMQTAIDQTVKKFGPIMGQMGTFGDTFGPLAEAQTIAAAGAGNLAVAYRDAQTEVKNTTNTQDVELKKQTRMRDKQAKVTSQISEMINDVMPYVTEALEDFGDVLMRTVDYMLDLLDYLMERFTTPVETKAAKKNFEMAFKDASLAQIAGLPFTRTDEQKQAAETLRKAKRLEGINRTLSGESPESPDEIMDAAQLRKDPEFRKKLEEEQAKTKLELLELAKQMGLEDVRVKQQEMKERREKRRKEREERRERQSRTSKEGGPVSTPAEYLPPPGSAPVSAQDLIDKHGLKLRSPRAQRDDMAISPKLIDLAKKIKDMPGFESFTAFNDSYHHKEGLLGPHTKGLAVDFILQKKPSPKEGEEIEKTLKGMGFDYALDEYNKPSRGSSGDHIHAQIKEFAEGGILRARPGGEIVRAAEGGYDEAFIPLKNGTVPVTLNGMNIEEEVADAIVRGFEDSARSNNDSMRSLFTSFQQSMNESLSRITIDREALATLVTVSREMVRTQQETNSLQTQMLRVVSN